MQQPTKNAQKLPKYTYPPDIQKAQRHKNAMRIFKGVQNDESGLQCECCQRRVGVQDAEQPCCYQKLQLAFMGPGVPLFFKFLQNSIILLIVLSLVFCIFALYSNIVSTDCVDTQQCKSAFDTISIINKASQQDFLSIQNYTLVAFVILSFIILQYFRYSFRKVEDDCDDAIDSPSDYAMILRRLPPEVEVADIQRMIDERRGFLTPQQRQKTQNLRVINIVMSFAMGDYVQAEEANLEEFNNLKSDDKADEFVPKPLPKLTEYASVAIVVFARQESKDMFKYKPNIFQKFLQCLWSPCLPRSDYRIRDQKIAIERAPQPDDINWRNCKISEMGAICRKTIYTIISIVILFAGGAVQYGLALAKNSPQIDDDTKKLILSTVSSICVAILNMIIQFVLIFTSEKERNQTKTQFNSVVMVKISYFQFLNTGIFVVLANYLADMEGFDLFDGVVYEAVFVMLLNACTPNLTLIFLTYFEIPLRIQRCLVERGTLKKSQLEANLLFQGPEAELAFKYAYIFKTIWLTAFYAPLAPIVVPISIFGLLINYFLQKIMFGKKYSIPNTVSSMLNDSAIELLQYFPLVLTLGELIIYMYFRKFNMEQIPENWSIPIFVALGLCILNLLLPMDQLNEKLFTLPTDNMVYPDYEKVEEKFQVTYEMTNPGYECQKKRKRDRFIMNKLFGNGVPMKNMFGGGNNDTRMGMMGNSPSPYNNGGNSNNNGGGNAASNPFGAMFANSAGNGNYGQPIQGNSLQNTWNYPQNNGNNYPNNGSNPNYGNNRNNNNGNNPLNAAALLGGGNPSQNQPNQQPMMIYSNSQPPIFGNNGQNYPPGYNDYHHPMHSPVTQAPNLNSSNVGFQQPIGQSAYYRPAQGAYESEKRSQNSQQEHKMRKKFRLPEAAVRNFKKYQDNLEY